MAECPAEAMGGFVVATTFCEVQTPGVEASCGFGGPRRGVLGLFETAAGFFLGSLTFISIHYHTREPENLL